MTRSYAKCKPLMLLISLMLWVGLSEKAGFTQSATPTQAEIAQPQSSPEIILVQFQPDLAPPERQRLIEQLGGELLAWLPALNTAQIRLQRNKVAQVTSSGIQPLVASEAIVFAEADGLVQATTVPDDPDITDQRKVYAPELLDLFAGWEYTRGDPEIIIAVLDSGIATGHPEFTDRLLPGYDFVQQDDQPEDENGHGTHVAGIVGARMDNSVGVAGVCAECSLLPVRVLNAQNIGSWMNVAQGVIFATDHGARVIVMSLGSTVYSQTMLNAIGYAQKRGVIIVAAAGNTNSADPFYPAAFPGVLGVGATTRQDQRWTFSNFGQNADVMAPGDAIYSTYLDKSGQGYQTLTGTSMAAPFVAGLAGLLLTQAPTRTISEVTDIITTTAVDLGDPGHDARFGYGRIDIHAALRAGAPTLLPSGGLTGAAGQDQDLNGQFDPASEQPLAGTVIQVQGETGHRTGLAVVNAAGAWRVSGLPTGAYTLHVTSTAVADLTPPPDRRVVLTAPVTLQNLNFAFVATPTRSAVAGFGIARSGQAVTLTWTVVHPLVEEVQVQRSTHENGLYTTVFTRPISTQEIATQQPITLAEELPAALRHVNVYYRLLLSPYPVYVGPKEAWPISGAGAHTVFIPFLRSVPEW